MIPTTSQLTDQTGASFGVERTGNSQVVSSRSNLMDISAGLVEGASLVHKFGNAESFATGDLLVTIWDGSDDTAIDQMSYTYSTTAAIDTISSSSAADTQKIEIQGLDVNWNLSVQTVTLAGFSQVTLAVPLIRAFRMKNVGITDNAGHVYLYELTADAGGDGIPDDGTKVRAVMQPLRNQTLMALYTVPADKTAYMLSFFAGTAGTKKTSSYDIELLARPYGGVFNLKHLSALDDTGTSHWNHLYAAPQRFEARTDIEMKAKVNAAAVTLASVTGGFDLVLIDN